MFDVIIHYATECFVAFLGDISTLKSGWNLKKLFCFPALELFGCLPLWKTVPFVSSRAFYCLPWIFCCLPLGKQWGYMEKSYKIQQRNWVGGVKKKAIFADFWWLGQKMCPKIFPTDFIFEMSGWIQATKYFHFRKSK